MDAERFDRLSRRLSTRRGVVGGAIGSLVSLLSLAVSGDDAGAKRKACTRSQKRCGKKCIPKKACCSLTQRRCGTKCVPKKACCPGTEKQCGVKCIPASGCCDPNECGAFNICVKNTCVIGQGTCSPNSSSPWDYCRRGESSRCDAGSSICGCYNAIGGARRCGDTRSLSPRTACENDAQCAFAFPNLPGVFCVDGQMGDNCPGLPFCVAPCPG